MSFNDYDKLINELYTPEIINLITGIYEYKGKQQLFIESKADVLNSLLKIAKIQSTEASNRIEGIYTSNKRLKELVNYSTKPINRDEEEILGYRDVLTTIHENYEFIPISPNIILQLHRDLYKYNNNSFASMWKNSDNIIEEIDQSGKHFVRFKPLAAYKTPDAMISLCDKYNKAIRENKIEHLLLISKFILDFLCIHPFSDGNGRMSRLLTILLLYKEGYLVPKYISFEKLIEDTKDEYYRSLYESSLGWVDNNNSNIPFIKYYLSLLLKAYKEFSKRVDFIDINSKLSKGYRIKNIFDDRLNSYSKADILNICPDISKIMVEKTLNQLLNEQYIIKLGQGKSTKYIRNNNL
ncbi:MAG: Fic family protein [Spirochaetia bacterium]|nr:Fic family protein [Spirochaetia bacterium]